MQFVICATTQNERSRVTLITGTQCCLVGVIQLASEVITQTYVPAYWFFSPCTSLWDQSRNWRCQVSATASSYIRSASTRPGPSLHREDKSKQRINVSLILTSANWALFSPEQARGYQTSKQTNSWARRCTATYKSAAALRWGGEHCCLMAISAGQSQSRHR